MTRVFIMVASCLLLSSFWQTFALTLPAMLNVFFFPPIILAFCLSYFRPFETVLIVLWCGAIVDILGGTSIGFNMLLMLLFFFVLDATSVFAARLTLRELSVYAGILSFFYRVAFFLMEAAFSWQETNFYLAHLCFGPLIDWLVSIPFYLVLMRLLMAIKAFDQAEIARGMGTSP